MKPSNLALAHAFAVASVEAVFSLAPLVLARAGVAGSAEQAAWAGLAAAAGVGASLLAQPFWGRWADSGHRRAMLARAYIGMALAALAALHCRGAWEFVLARMLLGLLGGGTLAASSFVASEGAAAIARVQAAALWGAALGPAAGGWLFAAHKPGLIALWAAGAAVTAAACAFLVPLREDAEAAAEKPRHSEAAVSASAGFVWAGRSLEDPWILALAGGNPALAGSALAVSRLSSALCLPAWGGRASRHGAQKTLKLALGAAAVLTAAQALPLGAAGFLAVRVLLGAAAGGLGALMMADAVGRLGESRRGAACAAVSVGGDAGKAAAGLAAAALPGPAAAALVGGALLWARSRYDFYPAPWRSECAEPSSTRISLSEKSPAA